MGDVKGFLKFKRKESNYRLVSERIKDFREVFILRSDEQSKEQASRCMDCGTPFCHWGCPLGNYIPEWNDLLFRNQWKEAFQLLQATNNFPEITGRICPALCEFSCVLDINDEPPTIRENELAIVEYAFREGLVKPNPPKKRTNKKIAIIGSGPAGLSCADQLNKAGHRVVVFEREDKIGGILRYGIPDFKLEKRILERRLEILEREGIEFKTNRNIGIEEFWKLREKFEAILLACGCRVPRDLNIEGRDLEGIYFALDYLIQANRSVAGKYIPQDRLVDAKDKRVVVIGGGDTGADCIGVANRQGASSVIQLEILPQPPEFRTEEYPWPNYPLILKTTSSHQEGGERKWQILTKRFIGRNGKVEKISCIKVEFGKDEEGHWVMKEIPGTEFEIEADLVILALGYLHPEKDLIGELHLYLDSKSNVKTERNYMTSLKGVFSCGDMHRGQSLIVWAISEGRKAAYFMDRYLTGKTHLPLI